ncbi:MAG: YjfB family protein [Pseudomonas sp.]|uniref:YjfB family protein n=1 Tax=Pseudomonas sp. TaxID=306 RepID=UPI0030F00C89
MELSNIAAAVSNAKTAQTASTVSILTLNKALDIQSDSALALIQAIPDMSSLGSNPPNLGNAIDVMV